MSGAKVAAGGTAMPHGEDASTTKNSAPVSFTMRRTSDNGSLAGRAAPAVAD
jgi:hypothetical protein